ncbi:MAG: hypothetical protein D6761_08735 [Candidatus Dadabacteria bacterium]|nr:MAG: hypothetical protein D6761_08735 [Candidatus Dadabacteria bacterium]
MRRGLLPDRSPAPAEPPVLVGAAEGQLHEVGAYCARLALTEAGRPVLYLGANVPVADLAATARRTQADVLCISFGPDRTPDDARRELRLLLELLPDADCRIIVGGRGADALQPHQPHITAIPTITALPGALEDHH